ncbi:hypothetical protein OG755_32410 [Streptomyces sp. NBC_01443]|nr:hypothetical protein [Streptomyces sp. NBC_01443]
MAVLAQRFHLDPGRFPVPVFLGLTLQPAAPVPATLRRAGTPLRPAVAHCSRP